MLFVYDAFHDKRLERLKRRLQKDIPVECGDVSASVLLSDELKKYLMNKNVGFLNNYGVRNFCG